MAAEGPGLGQPVAPADLAPWDISVGPDGVGLPPGRGTAAQGEAVYASKCQACHGEKGAGKPNDALVGGFGTIASDRPAVKTVGSYWPYATTLFDYVRRAMPWNETEVAEQRRALCGIGLYPAPQRRDRADDVIDAQSLPKVKMPNRDGFIPFPRYRE